MTPISVFDRVSLAHREDGDGILFTCDDPTLPVGEDNLVVRAAHLFCESFGFEPNLTIDLAKQIPHGAGLGGGSSDAAATLRGLNEIFATELADEELGDLAAALGSDIPFFVYRSAAIIRGRGEKVERLTLDKTLPLLLLKPPFGVPTPWAYSRWNEARPIPGVDYGPQRIDGTELSLFNDLERPVFEKHLLLADLKTWLRAQPEVEASLVSGSGATVFAVLRKKQLGVLLGERIAAEFGQNLWAFLCETV